MKFFLLIFKNLRRNKVRSLLTALAVVVLVSIFSMVYTVVYNLDQITQDKARDVKLIVTDRYRFPSRFDRAELEQIVKPGTELNSKLSQIPGFHADKFTIWQFAGFTLDQAMKDKDQTFFLIATIPETIPYMTDELEELDPKLIELMKRPPRSGLPNIGILMGPDRMARLNKKVGEVFKAWSFTHMEGTGTREPIEMEFEIVGTLPAKSRWSGGAFGDYEYLDRVLKAKKNDDDGKVNIAWLIVDDQESATQVSRTIEGDLKTVKCETLSSAVTRWLEPLKDFLWGLKFLVAPAIVIVITLIVANAISITVRERTTEMAILKVLGFDKVKVLVLVLGEAFVVGLVGGLIGGGLTQAGVHFAGGIPIGEGAPFYVSGHAWWWGPVIGSVTALVAGIVPSWSACRVKVSEVFARVA